MDFVEAKNILELNDGFNQKDLIQAYKASTEKINLVDQTDLNKEERLEYSNKLYDISEAFILLREKASSGNMDNNNDQPLIIFTDASAQQHKEVAAFGIVANNIVENFSFPNSVLKKYQIKSEPKRIDGNICVLSGIVSNYDINASEIMAILSSVEIFMHLAVLTHQKIVIYTDSLVAKKVLSDKRMPPNSRVYTSLRKRFNQIIDTYHLDVIIKKVNAHVGIELNEIADITAKTRLKSI